MKITFERTGGFAGMVLSVVIDTTTLEPALAQQIRLLVEAADFFQLPTVYTSPQPDRFQYQLSIAEASRQHTVIIGESAVPGTLRPLLDWLLQMARQGH